MRMLASAVIVFFLPVFLLCVLVCHLISARQGWIFRAAPANGLGSPWLISTNPRIDTRLSSVLKNKRRHEILIAKVLVGIRPLLEQRLVFSLYSFPYKFQIQKSNSHRLMTHSEFLCQTQVICSRRENVLPRY